MKFLKEDKEITKKEVTELFEEKYDLEEQTFKDPTKENKEKLQEVECKIQKIHIAQTGD